MKYICGGIGTRKEGSTDYAYRLGGTEGDWEVCHFVSVNWSVYKVQQSNLILTEGVPHICLATMAFLLVISVWRTVNKL